MLRSIPAERGGCRRHQPQLPSAGDQRCSACGGAGAPHPLHSSACSAFCRKPDILLGVCFNLQRPAGPRWEVLP